MFELINIREVRKKRIAIIKLRVIKGMNNSGGSGMISKRTNTSKITNMNEARFRYGNIIISNKI
jgi:hypothetical protein